VDCQNGPPRAGGISPAGMSSEISTGKGGDWGGQDKKKRVSGRLVGQIVWGNGWAIAVEQRVNPWR